MREAGKDVRAFFSIRTNEGHASFERSVTAADKVEISILGCKINAALGRSRCSGDEELVSRKTGALIGLKHPIAESILLCHFKVGSYIGSSNVFECGLPTGRPFAKDSDFVSAIHLPAVIHGQKSGVRMAQIVPDAQRRRLKRNLSARGCSGNGRNICTSCHQNWIVEKVIRSTVLLHDYYYVQELPFAKASRRRSSAARVKI